MPVTAADLPVTAADLTEQTILDLSGEDELCQVRELVLREHGLSEVGPLLERLTALEVLSLSNNNVHSLAGCASMGRLTTLNINFNRIASLEPLSNCPLLEKLFASSNKISTVAPLAACTRLKELSLFRNLVASLDGTLAVLEQLTALRVLDLGANPCALGPPYRHRIVSTLRLECLDGDPLTELDSELAADFGASSDASGQRVVAASADTRGVAASGAGSPSRRPTTAPAPHSKSLFRAPGSQNRAARRRKGRLAHTAPFSREPPRQRAVAAWGVVAAWEPWLAQASVAGVAGDPFLNSNAILLDYLSQAELEQADPPSVPADAASLSGGAEGDALFRAHAAPLQESHEQHTIKQLLRLVQELTAERDEAREKLRAARQASGSEAAMQEIESLQKQNVAFAQENANMYAVIDQNRALTALLDELRPGVAQQQVEGAETCAESLSGHAVSARGS